MKLADFKGLFKKSVATVESVENPYEDYYEIKLKPAQGIVWQAGEHGIFKLIEKDVKGKKWRAFSVASVPDDGYMLIGMRTGKEVSSFKSKLITAEVGDKVSVTGPFGWFVLQDGFSPLVLVAGGVRITPIKALLSALKNDLSRPIELIYASRDYYLFEEDIIKLMEYNTSIVFHKTVTADETSKKLEELTNQYGNEAFYYLSGPIKFHKDLGRLIKGKGVKGRRIIKDPFIGY
jgi:ferredoxin-NADP reductase